MPATLTEKLEAWGLRSGLTEAQLHEIMWECLIGLWHLIGLHERGRCTTLCWCPGRKRLESGGILFFS